MSVLLLLAFAGGAMAAIMWTTEVPLSFTVTVPPSYNLELYQNVGLTTPLTGIALGDLPRGASNTTHVYVKNVGDQTAYVGITHNLSASVGTITATPAPLTLTPGSSGDLVLHLTVSPTAPGGSQSVTITINSSDA